MKQGCILQTSHRNHTFYSSASLRSDSGSFFSSKNVLRTHKSLRIFFMNRQRHFLQRSILLISGLAIMHKVDIISHFFLPSALFGYIRSVDSVSELSKRVQVRQNTVFFPLPSSLFPPKSLGKCEFCSLLNLERAGFDNSVCISSQQLRIV